MIDGKTLRNATIIGTVLQVAMVVVGHYNAYVAQHVFMFGGMSISALAGLICGRSVIGYTDAALGAAIAGGVCALIGIALSVLLHDTVAIILAIGTLSSAVTGAVGGLAGQAIVPARPA